MDKTELRRAIRDRKRAMTAEEITSRSAVLAEKFCDSALYRDAQTIYGYLSYNQEVRTEPILLRALADGKRIAVPKVFGDIMHFIYMDSLEQVEKGYAGIPEPIADGPIADDTHALVLMPGLAFDPAGHRIGYGGGFYDKFLAQEPEHPTAALCYSFQVFPELQTDPHDIPVDLVLWD